MPPAVQFFDIIFLLLPTCDLSYELIPDPLNTLTPFLTSGIEFRYSGIRPIPFIDLYFNYSSPTNSYIYNIFIERPLQLEKRSESLAAHFC